VTTRPAQSVTVVGSGPSAVHFALSLLRKGHAVTMFDVGYEKPAAVNPTDSLTRLKTTLEDPATFFLGDDFRGVLLPGNKGEYYGIPPGKDYIFRTPDGFDFAGSGFAPLFSFAQGGMAETWTAGCYPYTAAEVAEFPFPFADLQAGYNEVARRIGVTGEVDDLARFYPAHEHLLEPLRLDRHSAQLMRQYALRRAALQRDLRCYFGRTRVATLSRDHAGRQACSYLGRCLWGCPSRSLYTPSSTLAECRQFSGFTYRGGMRVTHFTCDAGARVTAVVAEDVRDRRSESFPVSTLALGAGAMSSTQIFLESVFRQCGKVAALPGLMDNRQILVPFLNLRMLGKAWEPESYQYHLLGLGVEMDDPSQYVHGQITTLKTALLHPIMQNLPVDLRTAAFLVRHLHSALGIVNVNHHDTPRAGSFVKLEPGREGKAGKLVIQYDPPRDEAAFIRHSVGTVKRALRRLGCIVPPGMEHVRPMGASAHYAGTLPMSLKKSPFTTSPLGQSHDFANLYIVDGATFPFLPAKNITFSLMANAVRIADAAF
jgi:hypothetical protein